MPPDPASCAGWSPGNTASKLRQRLSESSLLVVELQTKKRFFVIFRVKSRVFRVKSRFFAWNRDLLWKHEVLLEIAISREKKQKKSKFHAKKPRFHAKKPRFHAKNRDFTLKLTKNRFSFATLKHKYSCIHIHLQSFFVLRLLIFYIGILCVVFFNS